MDNIDIFIKSIKKKIDESEAKRKSASISDKNFYDGKVCAYYDVLNQFNNLITKKGE